MRVLVRRLCALCSASAMVGTLLWGCAGGGEAEEGQGTGGADGGSDVTTGGSAGSGTGGSGATGGSGGTGGSSGSGGSAGSSGSAGADASTDGDPGDANADGDADEPIPCNQIPEDCNGLDDNCNGQIDEGDPGGGVACTDPTKQGVCVDGTLTCQNGSLACIQNLQPSVELCNGLDDNCNGATDENNPEGNDDCNTGQQGVCAFGKTNCNNGAIECVPSATPQTEVCNGLDDDCDGTPDQGFPGAGQPCTVPNQPAGTPCAQGTTNCLGGQSGCSQVTFPDSEICDAVDNDCNGTIDDPSVLDGVVCSTGLNGVCAEGKTKCTTGTLGCPPNIQPGSQPETCNALDDDCDGTVDDVANINLECAAKLPQADHVTVWACTVGFCSVTSCSANWGDCDGSPSNGCETNLLNTVTSCGGCGNVCNATNGSPYCELGTCKIACDPGFGNCDGNAANGCETPLTSTTNCGACGQACTNPNGSTVCSLLQCVPTCSSGFGNCDANPNNGCETNTNTSTGNCGSCGVSCTNPNGSTSCSGGNCTPVCSSGYANCDGNPNNGCETNTNTSTGNCGACGVTCTNVNGTTSCVSGVCEPNCSAGTADCDGNPNNGCETNVNTNANNCGACGTQCSNAHGTTSCVSGTCTPLCAAGYASCDGNPVNGCETNLGNSVNNCGACGDQCINPNGSTSCVSGNCAPICSGGWGNCDGNPDNGCETETATATNNCGTCGTVCTNAHGSTSCVGGACTPVCSAGWSNCDGNANNGCETNTNSDVDNCGTCGNQCVNPQGSVSCSGGQCQLGCNPGFANCDGNVGNGCETNIQTSINNCGGCNIQCTNPNGSTSCAAGACTPSCTSGWGNCDGNVNNGCETNVTNNVNNCGGCGLTCQNDHGTTTCTGGTCAPSCAAGWGNCDGNLNNGCETNLQTSIGDCGACGVTCSNQNGTTACIGAICVPSCSPGSGNCDGNPNNGCETNILNNTSHCGGCGVVCSNPNGGVACSNGTCAPSCNPGYASCDGNQNNGCEVNTTNNSQNCGSCGTNCTSPMPPNTTGANCQASSCEVTSCAAGWVDKDLNHANGCECSTDSVPNTCATATDLGSVPINTSDSISGNLTPSGDEDWYRIEFQTGATCAYDPELTLTTGGAPIRMQVFRSCSQTGMSCAEGSSGAAAGWTTWEFTYSAACGEALSIDPTPGNAPFINTAQIPVPTVLYVRVYASASSSACLNYTLNWAN